MPGARHIPMRQVSERLAEIPRDRRIALTCAGGTRSSLVASLLLSRGFTDLVNVWGGMNGWAQAGLPRRPRLTRGMSRGSRVGP